MFEVSVIEKRMRRRRLRRAPELTAFGIAWGASALIGALILIGGWRDESGFVPGGLFAFALVWLTAAVFCLTLHIFLYRRIIGGSSVPMAIRPLGYIAIFFLLSGNIFAAIAGFSLLREKKPVEYNLCCYALLNSVLAALVPLLNIFKDRLPTLFFPGLGLLGASAVFYALALPVVTREAEKGIWKGLKPLGVLLILSACYGNLFAFILGLLILTRIKTEGSARSFEWINVVHLIYRNYMAVIGFFVVTLLLTLSVMSFFTFDYSYAVSNDYANLLQPPSLKYPFGTDKLGLCVFTRIVFGARISLVIGMISTALPIVAGGLLGAIAGYYGERADNGIMRVLDVLYAVPSTLLTIAIVAAFGANTLNLILALSIAYVPVYARTMRAQVMVVSNADFVEAARACGRREWEILIKHIIPNALAPIIVQASVSIGIAVLSTSSLSYLGLGVEPHIPEWGNILKVGSPYLETHPYLAIYPGLFIIMLVLAFNFFGDGLRDALDPRLK